MEQFLMNSLQKVGLNIDLSVLMALCDKLGANEPADVKVLRETDVLEVLKPVPARKLIAYWNLPSKSEDDTAIPSHDSEHTETTNNQPSAAATPSNGLEQTYLSPNSNLNVGRPPCALASPPGGSRLPLPYSFPVHNIRPVLRLALTAGEFIRTGQRTELMEAIYQDVSKYTLYPLVSEWNALVDSLLSTFPNLKTESIGVSDVQSLWKSRLIRYFQNARSRRDNTLHIVVARKRKQAAPRRAPVKRPVLALFGVINYLPPRPTGETDDTIAEMIKLLVDENRRLKKNGNRIDDLMSQTFADRRRLVVVDHVSMEHLKGNFPCLFSQDQMFAEFLRLANVNVVDCLQNLLDKFGSDLIRVASDDSRPKPALLTSLLTVIGGAKSQQEKRDRMWAAAVLCIPYLLGENISSMIGNEQSSEFPVFIVRHGADWELFVNGVSCATSYNIPVAVGLLFVSFYVFHLEFPPNIIKTLLFLQKYAFCINEKSIDPYINRCQRATVDLMERLSLKCVSVKTKRKEKVFREEAAEAVPCTSELSHTRDAVEPGSTSVEGTGCCTLALETPKRPVVANRKGARKLPRKKLKLASTASSDFVFY